MYSLLFTLFFNELLANCGSNPCEGAGGCSTGNSGCGSTISTNDGPYTSISKNLLSPCEILASSNSMTSSCSSGGASSCSSGGSGNACSSGGSSSCGSSASSYTDPGMSSYACAQAALETPSTSETSSGGSCAMLSKPVNHTPSSNMSNCTFKPSNEKPLVPDNLPKQLVHSPTPTVTCASSQVNHLKTTPSSNSSCSFQPSNQLPLVTNNLPNVLTQSPSPTVGCAYTSNNNVNTVPSGCS